jgi:serine/threonine protein kinase
MSNLLKEGKLLMTNCGSAIYSPPEILMCMGYQGPEVDIWAIGVMLYEMVTGDLPWAGSTEPAQLMYASRGVYTCPDYLSSGFYFIFQTSNLLIFKKECKDLISKMLTVDRTRRASMDEIKMHPWVMEGYTEPPDTVNAFPIKDHKQKVENVERRRSLSVSVIPENSTRG